MAPPHGIWINEAESRRKVTTPHNNLACCCRKSSSKVCEPVSKLKQDGHMETGSAQGEYNLLLVNCSGALPTRRAPSHIFRSGYSSVSFVWRIRVGVRVS